MTQDPRGDGEYSGQAGGSGRPSLPDLSARDTSNLPDFATTSGPATLGEPSQRSRNRALTIILSVVGAGIVLIAVVALILSQTVFRGVLKDDPPDAFPTGTRTAEGQSEYVPDPEDPDIAPPPPIFTQAPTTDCYVPDGNQPDTASDPGAIRGGDLEFSPPTTWDHPWYSMALPYLDEVNGQGRNVEGSWYSVVNVGRVTFPDSEGGYPGLEPAAVAIFQCYATTSGVMSHFGENPKVTDYRTEATEVDGYPAWIVQATYHFEDPEILETSSASIVTAIVVDGPDGPSGLASDVAADQPEHVKDLEDMIAGLKVVR